MNSNQPTPNPAPRGSAAEMNDAVMKKLNSYRWKGRVLTVIALSVGLLSIAAGIAIAWANAMMIMPMERLLLQDYPYAVRQTDANSIAPQRTEAKPPLIRAELDWRHVQVTAAHGKAVFLTAVSIALLGVGTFLTLLLVIFNRHVTLRQINASLAQISNQIKELQAGQSSGTRP
jgi:hypothetical protein